MVLNVTFNNISVISWRSVSLVKKSGVPGENYKLINFITYCCIGYTLPEQDSNSQHKWWIDTDCIGSYKYNHHTIITTIAPLLWEN